MDITLAPIAYVRGGRVEMKDDHWGEVEASIVLERERFTAESLSGLEQFSHLLVVTYFHRLDPVKIESTARHPRNNTHWPKVGIFAQRAKNRPNLLGVSNCRIIRIEASRIWVQGLDAVDGTPVLDIKPVMRGFEPIGEIKEPDWAKEIMSQYW